MATRWLEPILVAFVGAACQAQDLASDDDLNQLVVRSFLREYLDDPIVGTDPTIRFSYSEANLDTDPVPEVVVYLTGRRYCGTSGCTMLILKRNASNSFNLITKLTLVNLPIFVLATSTNGWQDLGVWMRGGGIERPYLARFEYDDESYRLRYPSPEPGGQETFESITLVPFPEVGKLLY